MEGINQTFGTEQQANKPEEKVVEGRREKIGQAEIYVKSMFDRNMETTGVIKRILGNPFFENPSERNS